MSRRTPVRSAVVGVGTMGAALAHLLSRHGHDVVVADATVRGAHRRVDALRTRVAGDVERGLRGPDELAAAERVRAATVEEAVDGAHLVIEAVPEVWEAKAAVLRRVSAANPTAILATNTSSYVIGRLATCVVEPRRFLGLHFFNPADVVPAVEVVAADSTAPEVLEAALGLLRRVGKVPVQVKDAPGFVANRLQIALFLEAVACVEEGLVDPGDLDALVRSSFGVRLPAHGPFEIADMAGLDVYAAILDTLQGAYGARFAAPESLAALVDRGLLGVKSGEGFAAYPARAADELLARRDAAVRAITDAVAAVPAPDDVRTRDRTRAAARKQTATRKTATRKTEAKKAAVKKAAVKKAAVKKAAVKKTAAKKAVKKTAARRATTTAAASRRPVRQAVTGRSRSASGTRGSAQPRKKPAEGP